MDSITDNDLLNLVSAIVMICSVLANVLPQDSNNRAIRTLSRIVNFIALNIKIKRG